MGIDSRNPAEEAAAAEHAAKIARLRLHHAKMFGMDLKNPTEEAAAAVAAEHAAKMERQKLSDAKTTGIKGNVGETRSDAEIRAQAEKEIDAGQSVFGEPSIYDELPPPESGFWRKDTDAESDLSATIDENIKSFISFLRKGNYDHADELKNKVQAMVKDHPPTDTQDSDKYGEFIRDLIFQADKELTAQRNESKK